MLSITSYATKDSRPLLGLLFLDFTSGISISQCYNYQLWKCVTDSRPLSGISISQLFTRKQIRGKPWFSSPLGDIYFSITKVKKYLNIWDKFSSPLGDIYFSMTENQLWSGCIYQFSSPLGDIYFSIINSHGIEVSSHVLVPSRGYLFLNVKMVKHILIKGSSRPLSGISISQLIPCLL